MRKIFTLVILTLVAAGAMAQEPDSTAVSTSTSMTVGGQKEVSAEEADQLAQEGKYAEAIEAYEAIIASGRESAGLLYNLGYSYFKAGSLGKSILNFERAKVLAPADPDIEANLAQAYALTDKMETVDTPVVDRIWQSITGAFSSDGWAWLFVLFFFLALSGVAAFFFLDSVAMRKAGFFSAIVLLVCAFISVSVSLSKRSEAMDGSRAIIMASSSDLCTSPDKNGSRMTVLHEGTDVRILDELGEWVEVRLRDGNVGWLRTADIEKI